MNKTGKCHIFTLYFQEIPDDEKWIDTWAAIEGLARRARTVRWRREYGWKAGKAFLDYHKSGISIDTIEQPRVAVFISDKVDVEVPGKNGKIRVREINSWGCGGKTAAQLRRKLIVLFTQVLGVLDWNIDLGPGIKRVDVMGLLGFIAYQGPDGIESNA